MNIYESIAAVMGEIGAVGKNSRNQQQGFMFRGIDAVMNAINPALTKHKVFIVPEILDQTREERTTAKGGVLIYSICKVKYTFFAEDGSHIEAVVIGEGMDSGDKATNKAMSIAFKYACFQVFCIPTEEMKDPDEECHEPAPRKKKSNDSAKTQDTSKDTSKAGMVSEKDIEVMRGLFQTKGIDEAFVCSLYKLGGLKDVPQNKYANIMKHIDDIKAKQEEKAG
ncbi:MAG: ERF family protein [Lachnospiraceae bacterium]|nr:ERF family protein [Lachnospiraceae bacterium]